MGADTILQEVFVQFLRDRGEVTDDDILAALEYRREMTPPIGKLALQERLLTVKQVSRVLLAQCDSQLRFGQQAVELGFLVPAQVDELLELQARSRPGLPTCLVELGFMTRERMKKCRADFIEEAKALVP